MSASICPKGWKLPGGGHNSTESGKGTYNLLLEQYGFKNQFSNASNIESTVDGIQYNIASAPLYFVRAGQISYRAYPYNLYQGRPYRAGADGYYTASYVVYSNNEGRNSYLYFTPTAIPAHSPMGFLNGMTVRCIAR